MPNISAIPLVGAYIVFDNKAFNIYEGDKVTDLVYKDGPVQKSVTGVVRVLNVTSRSYSTGPDECPPESFIKDIISINELIIDTSEQYDADLIHIAVKDIISIASVNDTPPTELPIAPSMEMLFVYNEATWESAKSAGAPESWMPTYDPMVEKCPWMVLKCKRGTTIPMKLTSLSINLNNEPINIIINSATNIFKTGVLNMENEEYYTAFEMIVPKVSKDKKDYFNRSEVKTNSIFTAYAVANDEMTIKVSNTYSGPSVK